MNNKIITVIFLTIFSLTVILLITIKGTNAYTSKFSEVYQVTILNENGKLSLSSINMTYAYTSVNDAKDYVSDYTLSLKSIDQVTRYYYSFGFTDSVFYDTSDCYDNEIYNYSKCPYASYEEFNSTIITINVPYSMIGKSIDIIDKNNISILSIGVSKFGDYCGDNKCSNIESPNTCSLDCGVANDNAKNNNIAYYVLGVAIVLGGIILISIKKRKK